MNCTNFYLLLDDHQDRALDPGIEAQLIEHATVCAGCASRRNFAWRLRQSLRALPVPAPSTGFAERVLSAARNTRPDVAAVRRGWQRSLPNWTTACALAASMVLAVGLWTTRETLPEAAAIGTQPLRLVFRSTSALSNVTIELGLPEGVELVGYPGQRQLVWQSDLQAGANLLELPVRLHGSGGVVTATLNHGTEHRQFSVRVVSAPVSGATSANRLPQEDADLSPLSISSYPEEDHHA